MNALRLSSLELSRFLQNSIELALLRSVPDNVYKSCAANDHKGKEIWHPAPTSTATAHDKNSIQHILSVLTNRQNPSRIMDRPVVYDRGFYDQELRARRLYFDAEIGGRLISPARNIRAFISIQAVAIQTHPLRCHGDSRDGMCLYRSGLYRYKGS